MVVRVVIAQVDICAAGRLHGEKPAANTLDLLHNRSGKLWWWLMQRCKRAHGLGAAGRQPVPRPQTPVATYRRPARWSWNDVEEKD